MSSADLPAGGPPASPFPHAPRSNPTPSRPPFPPAARHTLVLAHDCTPPLPAPSLRSLAPAAPLLNANTKCSYSHLVPFSAFFFNHSLLPIPFPPSLILSPFSSSIFFYYSTVPRSSPGIHYLTKLFQGNHSSLNFYNVSFVMTS